MDDQETLRKRILHELSSIAPRSSTKEKMKKKLLVDLNLTGQEFTDTVKGLRSERWIWSIWENYFYLTDERITEIEKKKPGFAAEVEFFRNGGQRESTSTREPQPPLSNSWCKAVVLSPEYREKVIREFKPHHEVFRTLSRILYENYSLPKVDDLPVDEKEAQLYHDKLQAYLDWADPNE